MVSTSRILVAIVKMCYEAKEWDLLNENIMLLSKRRSQLKQVSSRFGKQLDACTSTTEPLHSRACALPPEKPPHCNSREASAHCN